MKLWKYIIAICSVVLIATLTPANAQVAIDVDVPGSLGDQLYRKGLMDHDDLTIRGMLDDRDFLSLRRMLYLRYLDLTQTDIRALPSNSLAQMRNLSTLRLPNNLRRIGRSSLEGCLKIYVLNIPNRVVEIGPNAFGSCNGLTGIDIPSSVEKIGEEAFMGCTSMSQVVIHGTPTIGKRAFAGCIGVKTFVCMSLDPPDVELSAFEGTAPQKQLGVPYLSVEAYKAHEVWGKLFNEILPSEER